ncbi:MAG: excinuclease ABC subunit UvrC, partial [Firmicutes bacterium]|nr:excinuclease ABC subunit UvrC [Bacillota bacterium]
MVRLTKLTRHSRGETEALPESAPQPVAPGAGASEAMSSPAPSPDGEAADGPRPEPTTSAGLGLEEKLARLPARPGGYLMKNAAGAVIYVGKASSLRSRVRSYFQAGRASSPRLEALVADIADLEYIVTASEIEALVLESNLIKRYRPWYNVKLRDDKAYPYLKVTLDEPFPRVLVVRRIKDDGARYFGPYTNSTALRETLRFLRKLFPIRTCDLPLDGKRQYRLCLQYYIGRCLGPCATRTTVEAYRQMIDQVCLFLEGRQDRIIPALEARMRQAAERLEFEQAARLRDQIRALEKVVEHQKVVTAGEDDQDVMAFARFGDTVCAQVFYVRGGKLIGRDHFILETTESTSDTEVMSSFVQQFYDKTPSVPPSVTLQHPVDEPELIERWLSERRGSRVRLVVPKRGDRRRLVEMAAENAALVLQELRSQADRRAAEKERALATLQDVLGLDRLPRRIEAFDISNIQGTDAVASMVVMEDGEPNKADYRRFKIRLTGGPNDFAMMKEAVRRRFARGLEEREALETLRRRIEARDGADPELEARLRKAEAEAKFARLPDLLLIDGGKGQLGAAREALRELGLDEEIPAIGLAKR